MRGVGGGFAGEGKWKSMEKKYWFFFWRQKKIRERDETAPHQERDKNFKRTTCCEK